MAQSGEPSGEVRGFNAVIGKLLWIFDPIPQTTPGHDGFAVTKLWPSNAELIAEGQAMLPVPTRVVRRLNFVAGIPS